MMFPSAILLPLLFTTCVTAHGYIAKININGKEFDGNVPNGETKNSIIRQINDVSPVKGAGNPAMFCGPGEKLASDIGNANPGDSISFDWRGGDNSNWPHNTGPMLTYMASCGDQPCNQIDNTNAKWFKIQQVGRKGKGQEWAQADLMNGAVADVKIPSTLAPGNYLIRHEIIGLHLAQEQGGAEFYPGCAQLKIGGNQNGRPNDNELVSFPGAYSDNDSGIKVNAFDANADYDFPGPQIASFVNGSPSNGNGDNGNNNGDNGNNNGNNGNNNGGNSNNGNNNGNGNGQGNNNGNGSGNGQGSDDGQNNNNSSQGASAGTCKLTKRRVVYVSKREDGKYEEVDKMDVVKMYKPRHLSRVMRRLLDNPEFRSAFTH
ncbi:hypothetical protein AAF712_003668 [Marasmius tenuissimus]|uniref:lytic cellulose monooxygenase (C4-dehydrogenating) n=1 Tax=Marasmius tenuissimus TaxID=585030 RepID=A0ABR3A8K1_9AGAR